MNDDKYVTSALILEVVSDIRLHLRKLVDLTERSLQVRCQGFEVFSRFELMEAASTLAAARKRHAEISARGPGGADWVQQEADARFELEAAEDALSTMLVGNHDAQRPGDPYWSRQRVLDRAAEFQPEGRRWKEHQARRKNHPRESSKVGAV